MQLKVKGYAKMNEWHLFWPKWEVNLQMVCFNMRSSLECALENKRVLWEKNREQTLKLMNDYLVRI